MASDSNQKPMKLNFEDDTLTTVSRDALRALANKLGFDETQTVLYALARLRDEVFAEQEMEKFMPLTKTQHQAIATAEPPQGKVIESLL